MYFERQDTQRGEFEGGTFLLPFVAIFFFLPVF